MNKQLKLPGIIPDDEPEKPPKRVRKPKAARPPKPERPPKPAKAPRTAKRKLNVYETAAAGIADPEAREAAGRALHAELKRRKANLIAARRVLIDYGPQTSQEWADRLAKLHAGREQSIECRRACREPGEAYMADLERLRREIDNLTAHQNVIFHAYASEATRAAWEAGREAREAAKRKRARLYYLDTLRWLGASEEAISLLPIRPHYEPPPDPLDTPEIKAAFKRLLGAKTDKSYERALKRFSAIPAVADFDAEVRQ